MSIETFILNAFTGLGARGNPAAVCPLKEWLPAASMQAIAVEINLSETAFIVPAGGDFGIRWFTPTREADLIGHATLAAGMVVLDFLCPDRDEVRFRSAKDFLAVRRKRDEPVQAKTQTRARHSLDMPALLFINCNRLDFNNEPSIAMKKLPY